MLSTLLEMSLAGGCLILVIIVLRALLLHRLPKALFFWLWMLALLRLLLPAFPTSPLSVFARWEAPAAPVVQQAVPDEAQEGAQIPQDGAQKAPAAPETQPTALPQGTPAVVTPVMPGTARPPVPTLAWMAVALLLALLLGLAYARGLRRFQSARPIDSPFLRAWLKQNALRRPVDVRLCERIDSPVTYGILHPVILLPETIGKDDTEALLCALEHELSHIRHFDAVWKLLIALAACLHWFNPLVWAMVILANRDIELCCDARVLRRGGKEERRAYASALLRMEEARAHVLPLTNAFSRNALEERIGAIMNAKKISITALLLTLLTVAVALTAFAAAPEGGTATLPTDREMTHAELRRRRGRGRWTPTPGAAASPQATFPPTPPTGWARSMMGFSTAACGCAPLTTAPRGILALDTQGNVDVCAVRDENGALTGLRAATQEEFDQNTMEEPRICAIGSAWRDPPPGATSPRPRPGPCRKRRRCARTSPLTRPTACTTKAAWSPHGRDGALLCGRGGGLRRAVQPPTASWTSPPCAIKMARSPACAPLAAGKTPPYRPSNGIPKMSPPTRW